MFCFCRQRTAYEMRSRDWSSDVCSSDLLLELANAVLSHQSLGAVRHAVLEALAREVGETCTIAIPAATHMIYWDRVETHWPLKFPLSIGSRVSLHCTAGGKPYLSSMPAALRAKLIAALGLQKRTAHTITAPR